MLASRGWTDIRRPAVFYHRHHWIGILCPLISDVDYMPNGLQHSSRLDAGPLLKGRADIDHSMLEVCL